jgi:hypothetical protein
LGRKKKYAPGEEPTPSERHAQLVERLTAGGGKRKTYNFRGEVISALEKLVAERPFVSETIIVSDAILNAAEKKRSGDG